MYVLASLFQFCLQFLCLTGFALFDLLNLVFSMVLVGGSLGKNVVYSDSGGIEIKTCVGLMAAFPTE